MSDIAQAKQAGRFHARMLKAIDDRDPHAIERLLEKGADANVVYTVKNILGGDQSKTYLEKCFDVLFLDGVRALIRTPGFKGERANPGNLWAKLVENDMATEFELAASHWPLTGVQAGACVLSLSIQPHAQKGTMREWVERIVKAARAADSDFKLQPLHTIALITHALESHRTYQDRQARYYLQFNDDYADAVDYLLDEGVLPTLSSYNIESKQWRLAIINLSTSIKNGIDAEACLNSSRLLDLFERLEFSFEGCVEDDIMRSRPEVMEWMAKQTHARMEKEVPAVMAPRPGPRL